MHAAPAIDEGPALSDVRQTVVGVPVKLVAEEFLLPLVSAADDDRRITWVHTTESRDPRPWLTGGELVLTTAAQVRTTAEQRTFVKRLVDGGVAAVALAREPGTDGMQAPLLDAAAEYSLPVLSVPDDQSLLELARGILAWLVMPRPDGLVDPVQAARRLERVVLSDEGFDGLARELGRLVAAPAIVFGPRGEVIGDGDSADAHVRDSLHRCVTEAVAGDARVLQLEMCGCGGHWLLAVPTGRRGRLEPAELAPQAWISAALPATSKPDLGRRVLQGARTAVALEVMLREAGQAAHRRLGATALAEIAAGELDGEATRRRLAEFGVDREVTAVMLIPDDGEPEALDRALEVMMEALASRRQAGLVGRLDDRLAVLSDCSEEDAYELAERLVDVVSLATGVSGEAAVSGAQPSSDAYRALYEAETICRTHAARGCSGSIGTSRDLNSADQLLLHQSPETLRRFCEAVLGDLWSVEAPYARELLRTLRVFLCEHGHWERTSRRLPCHRGTLRYRARKIEVMTGRDLTSASDRVELWLALRASELLGESDLGDLVAADAELADPAN